MSRIPRFLLEGQEVSRRVGDGYGVLTFLQAGRLRRPCDMSFPAIERRSVHYFGFYLSDSPLSKVQVYFDVLFRVLVENDDCNLTAGKQSSVSGRIDSRRLEL